MMDEPHSPRERLLAMAEAARGLPAAQRRRIVLGLIHECYRHGIHAAITGQQMPEPFISQAEIFIRAYGDPHGGEYWRAWMAGQLSARELATLLTAHFATTDREFEVRRREALSAIAMLPPGKNAQAVIERLLLDPNIEHLIPDGLRYYLVASIVPSPQRAQAVKWSAQAQVNAWMLQLYRQAHDAGQTLPNRDAVFATCKQATGATYTQMRAALAQVPADLRRRRGQH